MLIGTSVVTALVALVFVAPSTVLAKDVAKSKPIADVQAWSSGDGTRGTNSGTPSFGGPEQTAQLFREAPIGHRQPRASDIPSVGQLSPTDVELQRMDKDIDGKLTICRGC